MLVRILLLAAAGAAGALCRYGVCAAVQGGGGGGGGFPWGTLVVNVLGCFAAGLFFGLFEGRWALNTEARLIVFVGFLGAFTTFSSFVLETGVLLRGSQWLLAAGNVMLQNGVGFAALCAGFALSRLFV